MTIHDFEIAPSRVSLTVGLLLPLLASAATSTLLAQAPPGTDIHLVSITSTADGIQVGQPTSVTDREGYDNQPSFTPDGAALLYTSIDAGGQADIRRHVIASGDDARVTETAESEYSPTPMPGGGISVVRVEPDQKQRLWHFPTPSEKGPTPGDKGEPSLLLPAIEPVGYHAWIDDERLILFVLGEPPTLQLATVGEGEPTVLAHDIGRALARVPGREAMSFVHKTEKEGWWVTAYDPKTGDLERLIQTRPEREDYAWAPDGSLWMGDGSQLFRWHPDHDTAWHAVAKLPLDDVTRMAFHPDGGTLALVAARPAPPSSGDQH